VDEEEEPLVVIDECLFGLGGNCLCASIL